MFGAALCIIVGAAFWMLSDSSKEELKSPESDSAEEFVSLTQEQMEGHGIETSKAGPGILAKGFRSPANIIMHNDLIAHIYPKVKGTVHQSFKGLGDTVQAGEVLGTLESREIAEAKAIYLAALKKSTLTFSKYQREKKLFEKDISAEQELNLAENEWEEAEINLELARQKLFTIGLKEEEINHLPSTPAAQLSLFEMRSPINGKVIKRQFNIGELLSPENEAYMIADLNKVWAEINIYPQDFPSLKLGQEISLNCESHTAKAQIVFINPIIDPETRTTKAIAEIDNRKGKWVPGSFACALITAEKRGLPLVIPKEAVQEIDGHDSVFVQIPEGFQPRTVKLGRSDDERVEVLAGLTPGESYASKNTFLLKAELKKHEAEHMD